MVSRKSLARQHEDMPEAFALNKFDDASPAEIEAALERSDVVFFEHCPIKLPSDADMKFLRNELPQQSQIKNISYHPESDSIPGLDAPEDVRQRVTAILKDHRAAVEVYLRANIPNLAPGVDRWYQQLSVSRGERPRSKTSFQQ